MGELAIAIIGGPDQHPGYERVFPNSATQFPGRRNFATPTLLEYALVHFHKSLTIKMLVEFVLQYCLLDRRCLPRAAKLLSDGVGGVHSPTF